MCCDERIDKKHSMGKSLRRLKYMIRKTRVLLPARSVEKVVGVASKQGSLSIEAAIVIPLFLIFVLGMASLLLVFGNRTDIQNGMRTAAETLTRRAYYLERTEAEAIGINPITIKSEIKNNSEKADDISTAFSTYDSESGILDIVVNYDQKIPFLLTESETLHVSQRLRCRAWIGSDMEEGPGSSLETEKNYVYVTEKGTVYHKTKSCSYLDLSIHSIESGQISEERNSSGAKYYACPLCAKSGKPNASVYVTDYGTSWHNSTGCSGLKRKINKIDITQVGNLKPCSKCSGEH